MEFKGLDCVPTCNSNEVESFSNELDPFQPPARRARAFQNAPFIEACSTEGDKLHLAQNKRFKIEVNHIFRNERASVELQLYL